MSASLAEYFGIATTIFHHVADRTGFQTDRTGFQTHNMHLSAGCQNQCMEMDYTSCEDQCPEEYYNADVWSTEEYDVNWGYDHGEAVFRCN